MSSTRSTPGEAVERCAGPGAGTPPGAEVEVLSPATGRRVVGLFPRMALLYVERALGPDVADEVAAVVPRSCARHLRSSDSEWWDIEDVVAVAEAAGARCGDRDFGRRIGEEYFRYRSEEGATGLLVAAGDEVAAFELVLLYASKLISDRIFTLVERGPAVVTIESTDRPIHPFFCGVALGFFHQIPMLFGHVVTATHPECTARGDGRCCYRITWTPGQRVDAERVAAGRALSDALLDRYEMIQSSGASLVSAERVDELLPAAAERIRDVVTGSVGGLVAVRLHDAGALRWGGAGIPPDDVPEAAAALHAGVLDESWGVPLVAELASARRRYGKLAVLAPAGTSWAPEDQRLLRAYAGHVTATIEASSALASARADRDTAEALLGLARALAQVGTADELAQRITEAVPNVVHCDQAGVLRWDPHAGAFVLVASLPPELVERAARRNPGITARDLPLLEQFARDLSPFSFSRQEATGQLRVWMEEIGTVHVGAVPIVARDELFGMVWAGFTSEGAMIDREQLVRRLRGIADHAAVALDNSHLLDAMRHQALHDPLTGLPNRALVEDRIRRALAHAERIDGSVTVLFLDLDRFKAVNDRLGHAAGDQLLCQVAERLRRCLRGADTIGRLGGDEFLVLLEGTPRYTDGERVADVILRAMREPFEVMGRSIELSVSAGISTMPGRGTSYEAVLGRADAAMYRAKRNGRDGWARDER